jgi:hypothetical protein
VNKEGMTAARARMLIELKYLRENGARILPLELMLITLAGERQPMHMRMTAAVSAAPYVHRKMPLAVETRDLTREEEQRQALAVAEIETILADRRRSRISKPVLIEHTSSDNSEAPEAITRTDIRQADTSSDMKLEPIPVDLDSLLVMAEPEAEPEPEPEPAPVKRPRGRPRKAQPSASIDQPRAVPDASLPADLLA